MLHTSQFLDFQNYIIPDTLVVQKSCISKCKILKIHPDYKKRVRLRPNLLLHYIEVEHL